MPVLQTPARQSLRVTWEPLPEDFHLPDDPVENIQQPPLAAALTDALGAAQRLRPEMLVGSNFGLVASIAGRIAVKAPDWFYVPHVQPIEGIRRSYTPNLEGDRVAVVMEFLSAEDNGELSLRATPPYGKLFFYEQILQVPTYATYDPAAGTLEVRCLSEGRYALQSANAEGRFWIPELELFLGIWHGDRLAQTLGWLRWWGAEGNLLLWSAEQAEQERQRAEQERDRAEQERQRADQERQRADRLAELLRAQGIDPDAVEK